MGVLKGVLWVALSIILVVSILLSVTLLTANTLLYPDIYVKALGEGGNESDGNFEEAVEETITNFLSYIRGETEELDLTLNIEGEELEDFLEAQIEGLPVCEEGQSYEEDYTCRPSDMSVEEVLDEILSNEEIEIPETQSVDLLETMNLDTSELEQIRGAVRFYKMALYLFVFLSLVFAVLMFVAAKEIKKGAMALGTNLIITGLILFVSSLTLSTLVTPSFGVEFLTSIINSVRGFVVSRQNLYGIILVVLGGLLVAGSVFLKPGKGKIETKGLK